ncbi:hypothetical protein NPA08_04360 [Mycoplasmopsis citelli]|uniref:Uncharacterized protein n=1 Tax=Mycoplasmopsis citelli TaxID=171281 RepID=A0A449B2G2_9BACT|nr:hypothetical protein [Mycoplasmopsis citelli]UUD36153.1 hypothetical protein NPA08_04360 [Mycoplasmopsis citelli]VEU74797.1 Uncharacterised protein [Mycoplasmopsis citelli]
MFSWLVDSILYGVVTPPFWIFIWIPFLVVQVLDFIFQFISFNLFNLIFFGKSNLDLNNFSFANFHFNPLFLIFLLPIGLFVPYLAYRALKYQTQYPESGAFRKFIRNLPKYVAIVLLLPFGIYFMTVILKFIVLLIKQSAGLNNTSISDSLWDQIRFVEWNKNRGWDVNEWRELTKRYYWWDFSQWRTIYSGDSMSFLLRGFVLILIYLMLVLNFALGMAKLIWKLLLMLLLSPIYNIKLLFYDKNSKDSKQYWNEIKGLILSYLFCLIGYSFVSLLIELVLPIIHSLNIFKDVVIVSWVGEMILTAILCFALTSSFSKLLEKFPAYFGFNNGLDLSGGTRLVSGFGSAIVPKKVKSKVQQSANKFKTQQIPNSNSNATTVAPKQNDNLNPSANKSSYNPINLTQIKSFAKENPIFPIPIDNQPKTNNSSEININIEVENTSGQTKSSKQINVSQNKGDK